MKITALLSAAIVFNTPFSVLASEKSNIGIIKGKAVTGFNRSLSQPLWDLGEPFGFAGFNFLFKYTPGAVESDPLMVSTPKKSLVSTGIDQDYLALSGLSFNDINYQHLNTPLRDIFYNVGNGREQLEQIAFAEIDEISKVAYGSPITLKNWLSAKGKAKYKCNSKKSSQISFSLNGLIANGVYTAWGVFNQDTDDDGMIDNLAAIPFGGLPNVIVADAKGKAVFNRHLNFCPSSNENLLVVEFDYHSDGNVYGGVPDDAANGLPSGIITHSQIAFPFNVQDAK